MSAFDDSPSLSEIGRTLADFRSEMRGQIQSLVRADVYAAERRELDTRIKAIEDDRASMRRMMLAATLSAIASLIVGVVLAVVR